MATEAGSAHKRGSGDLPGRVASRLNGPLTWRWPDPASTVWKQVASVLGGDDRLTSRSETTSFWLIRRVKLSRGSSGLIRNFAASGSCPCVRM